MGWQDRDYNAGDKIDGYMANPASILSLSFPIYKSQQLYIRVHFWFVITAIFIAVDESGAGMPIYFIPMDIAIMLVSVLLHEATHRFFAQRVGGNHWEWVLWPSGGMIAPHVPRNPKAIFIANFTAVVASGILGLIAFFLLLAVPDVHIIYNIQANPIQPLLMLATSAMGTSISSGYLHALCFWVMCNVGIAIINLFPCFWFDGGHIWQSILWPKLGQHRATMITCIAGMVFSVPLFFISLIYGGNMGRLLGMIMWVLIFADCFTRRRALQAVGPAGLDEEESAYDYMNSPQPERRKKKMKKRWFNSARKKARRDQAEQAKIDAILVKVKEKGLHSLTWWEKRTLKKATERQRQHDLAERL